VHLSLKGGSEGVNYFSVAKEVLAIITMVQHSNVRDMGGAILHGTLIGGVADGILTAIRLH
jgi:hypothetical protein